MAKKKKAPGFTKPGRGIERDAKPKNAFFRFFELLIRKIYRLCILNVLYFICILPLICALITLGVTLFAIPAEVVAQTIFVNWMMRLAFWLPTPVSIALVIISAVFYGPMTCGFSYAMRNLATEKHVWYSEFFTRSMQNFKQGFAIGLVDILVFTSVGLYISTDFSAMTGGMLYFYSALRIAAVLIGLFYIFMRYYLYTITVTFALPLKAIFKNAYLFGVLGLWRNILVTVINMMSIFAFASTAYIDMFLMATFAFSFCGFLATYTTYPVIQKYMIDVEKKADSEDDPKKIEEEIEL